MTAFETLVQSSLAWSFLLVYEKLIPNDISLLICSRSVFIEAKRFDWGFFFTLAASDLAASWAAISASVGVAGLTSGRVLTWTASVPASNKAAATNYKNFIIVLYLIL